METFAESSGEERYVRYYFATPTEPERWEPIVPPPAVCAGCGEEIEGQKTPLVRNGLRLVPDPTPDFHKMRCAERYLKNNR